MRTALNEPKNYRAIMLSSTFTDLKEHRQKAIEAISKLGYMPRAMEHTGARADADVIESSLNMVRDSTAYIGVIGQKYGQTPVDPVRNPDQLSITELEFSEAMRLGRPIVLFVMGDDHPVKKADVETDPDKRKKLDVFRDRAKRMRADGEVQRIYETFESLEQFAPAAAIAFGNLIQQIERSPRVRKNEEDRGPRGVLSNIPISVPLHFLGRDDDLAAIDAALKGNNGRAAITALHGLRGVGKTILAAAYAERHGGDYRATWWIRAETESMMRADLVGLGVQLGWVAPDAAEEPALAAVLELLRRDSHGVLLIYDNAIGPNEVNKFLPRGSGPHIIITSNAPNWRGVAAPVPIEVWPEEIGADYLIARTGRIAERDAALALSQALGGLPLAHEQAAAYCERIGVPLAEYLKRFETAAANLLDDQQDASREYHDGLTVAKTFALAISEAAKRYPAAEPLIVYAALLAPEPIPLYLFSEAAEEFGETFALAIAGDGLDEAVAALRAFALIDRETIPDEREPAITTDCIRLHRLVRQVAAVRRDGGEDTKGALIAALSEVYPRDVFRNPGSWPRARRLDALALALVGSDEDYPQGAELSAASLLSKMDSYRDGVLAAYAEARNLSERALAIYEKVLGPDHVSTAASLNNLGFLLQKQGELVLARRHFERALMACEKSLGPNHPNTASCLSNLGGVLQEEGDLTSARSYYERGLAICEATLGPNDAETGRSVNDIGFLLLALGEFASAQPYFERALAICEATRGFEHPDTASCLSNLGSVLQNQGATTDARPYLERALVIFEKFLGPLHPSTQIVANNTVGLLDALGDIEEAENVRRRYNL
jgi:tetratricopeptide (TPR) repeat protein